MSSADPFHLILVLCALVALFGLTGCCTSTLQPGCDPMPKWHGYQLEYRP